jgi:SPP1 Gp6-like portal protein
MSIVTLIAADAADLPPVSTADQPIGSVGYWLKRLGALLNLQTQETLAFNAYYVGQHPLQFATSKFRETFGSLFSEFADNWCPVVVDSSAERLKIQGFRFGVEGYAGDEAAWRIWQANGLDADSGIAHTEAIKTGHAYVIVDVGDGETPIITVESPTEVITENVPGNRRQIGAALKRWIDDTDGRVYARVFLPDATYRFRSAGTFDPYQEVDWKRDEPYRVPNAFGGLIPVVPIRNNPTMLRGGRSDLEPVIDLQNAINKIVTDMLVASEYASFRQRWISGIEIPIDPETGRPNASRFLSSVSRIWAVEDENVKFGEFGVTDLNNYVRAVETLIQHLAAQTRTPPHYLTAGLGQWPSGDSLKASEAGLVAKVKRKQLDFGEAWESVMRLAFLAIGEDAKAQAWDAEVIWSDPEYRTESQLVDALTKMSTIGVPREALWERWGATPQEIERWRAMDAAQARVDAIRTGAMPTASVSTDIQTIPEGT